VRCILYIMKRTQLYMEDDVWKALQIRAKQSKSTISELVRQAVREKYLDKKSERREAMLSAIGLWKNRTDLPDTETYVRSLRDDDRLKRIFK
jgi:predicted transcriptional regulator